MASKDMLLVFWSAVHKLKFSAELFTIQLNPIEKTIITTEVLSFLSVEKNHSPFSLNFVLRASIVTQRPMIIIANLKKSIRVRPLVKNQAGEGWPIGYLQSVEELNLGPSNTNPINDNQLSNFCWALYFAFSWSLCIKI